MTILKLSDLLYVSCIFMSVVILFCQAVNASDELRRFILNTLRNDNCGCQMGICIHLNNGGFRCDCYNPSWVGEKCDILAWTVTSTQEPKQQGALDHCYNNCVHGHCVLHPDPLHHAEVYRCECEHGWYGEHCTIQQTLASTQEPNHQGALDHCYNNCVHGHCAPHPDPLHHAEVYRCECEHGWFGEHCTIQQTQPVHMDHCNNRCQHGVCVGPSFVQGVEMYHCQCEPGWHGLHCEQSLETTHMDHCNNRCQHGVCAGPSFVQGVESYHCQCDQGWHGGLCDQQQLSYSNTGNSTCDISAVMTAVTTQSLVVNENATECSTGSHSSHDALVLTHCKVPKSTSSWKQGINVMSQCSGPASLPASTPVAAFDNRMYSSKGSLSGIFIACTSNGFQMAFQVCGQPPQIADIRMGGTNALNPAMYYTVV